MAGADLGRMVRRSDHCLPSDSDKFTIKLHSLPSKFLSSLSPLRFRHFLSHPVFSLETLPAYPFRAAGASSLLRTRGGFFGGIVVYSLAITITHYTPAPSCFPSLFLLFSALFALFLLFRPSRPRIRCILYLTFFVFSLCFFAVSFPFRPSIVLSPRLFRNCFRLFLLLLRLQWRISRAFRYVTAYFTGISSLLFSLSFFRSSFLSPCCPTLRSASISRFAYSFLDFCPFALFALSFFLLFLGEKWMLEFIK